jgi:hypothetical protein
LIVQVWDSIFKWRGSNIIVNASVFEHFLTFGGILKRKKTKWLRHIIYGWQLLGVFGDFVTTFCLEEIVLIFLLFLIKSCILLGCGL